MIRHSRTRRTHGTHTGAQRGVALVVAMVLLLVATLIGLAASRGTVLQERMSSNSFDRSLAFQRSESALRARKRDHHRPPLPRSAASTAQSLPAPSCPQTHSTARAPTGRRAPPTFDVNDALTPGVPQYHIALMGTGPDAGAGMDENAPPMKASTAPTFQRRLLPRDRAQRQSGHPGWAVDRRPAIHRQAADVTRTEFL